MNTTAARVPLAAAAAVVLAGCGSMASAPDDGHATVSCGASELQGRIGDAGSASGTLTERIHLTNTSESTCTLRGYPHVAPVRQSGAPIDYETVHRAGLGQQHGTGHAPGTVTLHPGQTAHAVLSYYYGWITAEQKARCVHWDAIAITPPGGEDRLLIPDTGQACHVGPIEVGPIEPAGHGG